MKLKITPILLFPLFLVFVFASCTCPQKLLTNDSSTVSQRDRRSMEKDSVFVYMRDSVVITTEGGTVYVTKWHTRYRDRFHYRTDTLHSADTLRLKTTLVKTVKMPLNGWQNFQLWCGRILVLLLFSYLLLKTLKHKLKPI